MKVVGITGGIGSGKSTISKMIKDKGYLVYDMDNAGKRISDTNIDVIKKTKELFGDDIYDTDNKLKRKDLGKIVFMNKDLLKQLTEIIHPYILKDYKDWVELNKDKDLLFVENAILFESGYYTKVDIIISIYYPEDLRIKRVIDRDNCTEDEVRNRMKNQMDDLRKVELSDYVLFSLDSLSYCETEINKIIKHIKSE